MAVATDNTNQDPRTRNAAITPVYSKLPFSATPERVWMADIGNEGIVMDCSIFGNNLASAGRNSTNTGATIPAAVFLAEKVAQTVNSA